MPQSIADLIHLENIFDVMDIYLWLSYRFIDMFPHGDRIRAAQTQLDDLIQQGVAQITRLIKESNDNIPEQSNSKKKKNHSKIQQWQLIQIKFYKF